jgi:hypothetical protein
MANYLKGIGDAATRVNEIMPSFDARINGFIVGHTAGIISGEYNTFSASGIDRGVIVRSGMMQAYGYFGCSDTDTQINFVMPSTTQYVQVYAEIDLSVVPNRFAVKATAMSNSSAFAPRQDNLKTVVSGKYQFPLWQVTLTASTITLTDRRAYISKILNAVNAEGYTSSGGIATKFTSIESAITTMGNSKLPKMTLLMSAKSYTITTTGVGSTTQSVNSGTSIASGDLLLVNARITNYGTRAFSGIVRVASGAAGWLTATFGGNGMPYSCLDTIGVSVTYSSTSQLILGGFCRTRIRGDSYDSDGQKVTLADAAYTIDSIYKINL